MGGKQSPCSVIQIRCMMRLSRVGESAWLKAQQWGECERSTSGSWCVARSTPSRALGWETACAWWPWCVSATRPIIVAWRVLSGPASEKGKEAEVTRSLIEQVLQAAGPKAISLRLPDALYADGPLLAWLKYRKGIDAPSELAPGSSALTGSAGLGHWAAH
jgi:hypothetical protein